MKLNPDCIRGLLLEVEDATDFLRMYEYDSKKPQTGHLKDFSREEILYHIRQCSLSELILGVKYFDNGESVIIPDLSPAGHKFLNNVRQDTIWNHTKTIAEKVGSKSLDMLIQISSNVITEIIKAQLGLP